MLICVDQWHARIGLFVARSTKGKFKVYNGLNIVSYKVFALIIMLLLTHGDIENNPGPKRKTSIQYNILHKFDVICISETYLDKSADNDALPIDGYNIIRADHPYNQKRGGLSIYYTEQLKLKQMIIPNFS